MKRSLQLTALLAFISRPASGEDHRLTTPGFIVTVDRQAWIRVHYRGIPIVTGSNFTIAKPGWKGHAFPNSRPSSKSLYQAKSERNGNTRKLTMTGQIKGLARNTITIEAEAQRVRILNEYEIEANPDVGYVYTECFLSKELLNGASYEDDAANRGVLQADGGKGIPNKHLRSARLMTKFGAIAIAVEHEHTVGAEKGSVGWELRNVSDRTWGAEDRRTFSIPNVYCANEPAPIRGRSEYVIEFEPNAAFEQQLAQRRAEQEARREALMAERRAKLAKRAERIEKNRGIVLMPTPQQMEVLEGSFVISPSTRIVVTDNAGERGRRPALRLAEELRDYYRMEIPVVPSSQAGSARDVIAVGDPKGNRVVAKLLREWERPVTPSDPRSEGYLLEVRPTAAFVSGSDVQGTWYGVQALLELLRWEDDRLALPCVRVRDWPEFEVRAMMLTLGVRNQMDFLRHTLRRVLPRMRMNMVFIGGASLGKVCWPSHPEIAYPSAFTPEDIRELADLARENFIEPVPHVQGFGHTGPLKESHPELLVPAKTRQPCFDITKPAVRDFVFDIYGDAIDAFKAQRYFHVGFDEAQGLQLISKGRDPAEIVSHHITAVSQWLEKRSLRTIMWADMLLDNERFGESSAANSRKAHYGNVNTAPAIGRIPKSIVLANWYYGGAEEHPQLEYLTKLGFHVFPTTWWLPENNHNFLRSAHKAGLKWASGSSWMYCAATNPSMMNCLIGEYAWTPNRPSLAELNYEPLDLLCRWMKPPRPSDARCTQTPIDILSSMNESYIDDVPGDDKGWLDLGAERDLSAIEPGRQKLGRYVFDVQPPGERSGCVLVRGPGSALKGVPTSATTEVGRACDSLVFLHTAHFPDYSPRALGSYEVKYDNGDAVSIPLRNAINIGPWLRTKQLGWWRRERLNGYYLETKRAWVGYTLAGDEVDLVAFEWVNPKPTAAIAAVKLELSDRSPDLAVGLFALTAVCQ